MQEKGLRRTSVRLSSWNKPRLEDDMYLILSPYNKSLTFTLVTLPRFNSSFNGNDVEPVLLFVEFGYLCHCPVSLFRCFFFCLIAVYIVLISGRNKNMDMLISLNLQHTNMIVYSGLSIKPTFHIPVS